MLILNYLLQKGTLQVHMILLMINNLNFCLKLFATGASIIVSVFDYLLLVLKNVKLVFSKNMCQLESKKLI